MFKKLFFSVILLIISFSVFSAFNLGELSQLTVTAEKTSDFSALSGAQVSCISQEKINSLHAESTSDILKTVSGIDINSYGALGAAQSVSIRGLGSSRTIVCINGRSVVSSHDSSFDFSQIPPEIIERIEIESSGVSAGGMVNIITRKACSDSLKIGFENGSFMPEKTVGLKALFDSQKITVSGSKKHGNTGVFAMAGVVRAANNFAYSKGLERCARQNAGMWSAYGNVSVSHISDNICFDSDNLFKYEHAGVPGSKDWLSPSDSQSTLFLSTANSINVGVWDIGFGYSYNPLKYFSYTKSEHKKHMADLSVKTNVKICDDIALTPYVNLSINSVNSTDYSSSTNSRVSRLTTKAGFSACFSTGLFSFNPLAEISYVSDMRTTAPSVSSTFSLSLKNGSVLSLCTSYAVKLPSFSDMYWKYEDWGVYGTYCGNPNLKPEKAFGANLGYDYANAVFSGSVNLFAKLLKDEIHSYMPMPVNISKSFYYGFDVNSKFTLNKFTATFGWMFNKSNDITASVPVDYVRKHTVSADFSYDFDLLSINVDAKYMGKYCLSGLPIEDSNAFIANFGIDFSVSKNLKMYVKADNLFNVSYELAKGYPMPGLKIRIGGDWILK